MLRRLAATAAIGAGSLFVISGCSGPLPADTDRLQVVATTTQLGQVAGELGGPQVRVTTLLTPGAEAHELELTPQLAAAIEDARIILVSGAGLETWLEDTLQVLGGEERVRDMSAGAALRTITEDGVTHPDPHYWLAATNAQVMVGNVRDALSAADPANAGLYAGRAARYIDRLAEADRRSRQLIGAIPSADRAIVTNHDALGYFIDAYGLTFVGSIFASLDVSAEPNPQQLASLTETIRQAGVRAIFSESAVNPRLARAIADESGATVAAGVLYTDSLGPPGSGADTLDGMLLHDATVISDALSGADELG